MAIAVPDHVIQARGRWKSDCYKLYLVVPSEALKSAAIRMASTSAQDDGGWHAAALVTLAKS